MSLVIDEFDSVEHITAIGKLLNVSGDYGEKFKIGGNQKIQKIMGKDLFFNIGKKWYYNTLKIKQMSTTELNILIKKFEK